MKIYDILAIQVENKKKFENDSFVVVNKDAGPLKRRVITDKKMGKTYNIIDFSGGTKK